MCGQIYPNSTFAGNLTLFFQLPHAGQGGREENLSGSKNRPHPTVWGSVKSWLSQVKQSARVSCVTGGAH